MSERLSNKDVCDRIGRLPEGFYASAVYCGGDYAGAGSPPADDWMISISGHYGGTVYDEMLYLPNWQLGFISAVRDKLMVRHWQRMKRLAPTDGERAVFFDLMQPFSRMEELNHAFA